MATNIFTVEGVRIILEKQIDGEYKVAVPGTGFAPEIVKGELRDAFDWGLFIAMGQGLLSIESYHNKTHKSEDRMKSFIESNASLIQKTENGSFIKNGF